MTDRIDRRSFIKAAGAAVSVGAVGSTTLATYAQTSAASVGAETIFRGETIVTMDEKRRSVAAVAVSGSTIIAPATSSTS